MQKQHQIIYRDGSYRVVEQTYDPARGLYVTRTLDEEFAHWEDARKAIEGASHG